MIELIHQFLNLVIGYVLKTATKTGAFTLSATTLND
jgi:hypothetical protein